LKGKHKLWQQVLGHYFEMDPVVTVHAPELIAALDSQAIVVAVTHKKQRIKSVIPPNIFLQ